MGIVAIEQQRKNPGFEQRIQAGKLTVMAYLHKRQKDKQKTVWMNEQEMNLLKKLAEKLDCSDSEAIRFAVEKLAETEGLLTDFKSSSTESGVSLQPATV